MSRAATVERVIVVPRNGLANRLQAWASAETVARDLGVPLSLVWETESVMPATAEDLFEARSHLMTSRELTAVLGAPHSTLPRYLTRVGEALVLAGHDRGEQAFMEEVARQLAGPRSVTQLVFIAGGNFHLPGSPDPARRRGSFYRSLEWTSAVTNRVSGARPGDSPYVALHVRQTDRSREAPTDRAIRHGLEVILRQRPERSLFIAADTQEGYVHWAKEAGSLGFTTWSAPAPVRDRTQVGSTLDAAADWLLLGSATAIVHPAASTFSVEAAIASGQPQNCVPLTASRALQQTRAAGTWMRSAISYPSRRLGSTGR